MATAFVRAGIDISTLSPEKLTFGFAAGTAVKYIEPAADEPQLLKGYPLRVVTGRYQTEFEYSVSADEGGEEYVSGFTAAQYISSNMDLDLAAAGTPDSTMVVTLQPDVSLSASYTRSGETCSYVFTEPQGAWSGYDRSLHVAAVDRKRRDHDPCFADLSGRRG